MNLTTSPRELTKRVDKTEKDRLQQELKTGLFVLLLVGLQLCLMSIGLGIRCPLRTLTGLQCPGCGVSHLAMHMLTGHPVAAFFDNPVVFTELPVLAIVIGRRSYRYIKNGRRDFTKNEERILIFCLIFLVIFGVLRNIL